MQVGACGKILIACVNEISVREFPRHADSSVREAWRSRPAARAAAFAEDFAAKTTTNCMHV
jgi:hypothetical protein